MSIELKHIQYVYGQGTAYEKQALKDVSLEIPQGQFVGIIGHTGSGKSTLIQHFNGLIKAASGELYYEGKNIYEHFTAQSTLFYVISLILLLLLPH